MKVYNIATLVAGATAVVAQSLNDPCTQNTCAGATLSTNIILRCVNGKYQPGNCNDNLAGVPPVGVKSSALCYIYDNTADCSLNGVVYKGDGSVSTFSKPGVPSTTTTTTTTPAVYGTTTTTTTTTPAVYGTTTTTPIVYSTTTTTTPVVYGTTTIVTVTVPYTTTTTTNAPVVTGTGSPTYPGGNVTTPTVPTVPTSSYTGAASSNNAQLAGGVGLAALLGLLTQLL